MIFLDSHERFRLLDNEALGMHLCMISRKVLHQLFLEILRLLYLSMSQGSRLESRSFANWKLANLYRQTFRGIAGLGKIPHMNSYELMDISRVYRVKQ